MGGSTHQLALFHVFHGGVFCSSLRGGTGQAVA